MKHYLIPIMIALAALFGYLIDHNVSFISRMVIESLVFYLLIKIGLSNVELNNKSELSFTSKVIPIIYILIMMVFTLILFTSYIFDKKILDVAKVILFSVKKMYLIESSISIYFKQAFGGFLSLLIILDGLSRRVKLNEYIKYFTYSILVLFLVGFSSYITRPVILQSAILALMIFSSIKYVSEIQLGKIEAKDSILEFTFKSFVSTVPIVLLFSSYSYIFPLILIPILFAFIEKLYFEESETKKLEWTPFVIIFATYLFLSSSFYLISGNKILLNNIYIIPFLLICFFTFKLNKAKLKGVLHGDK